jgi:hypothetical protein
MGEPGTWLIMQRSNIKTIAASLILLGASLFLVSYFRVSPPPPESWPHQGLGRVLADEASKLLGPGGRIRLITRDTAICANPATDLEVKAFVRTLRATKLTVTATNLMNVDPLRPVRVPPGDFLELMRKLSENDVVVSLLGPPFLTAEQRAKLPEKRPRVVALCSGAMPRQENLRELFEQNLLQVAIISRENPSLTPPASDDPQAWFAYLYQVITPANLADLPPPMSGVTP